MNCYFCKCKCTILENDDSNEIWGCYNHPYLVKEIINYTWHVADKCEGPNCCPQKHHTSTIIVWGAYKAKFRHYNSPTLCIYKDGSDMPVLRLSFHPHLTPENIAEKLPVWITFS